MDEAILTRREIRRRAASVLWITFQRIAEHYGLKWNDQVNQCKITTYIRFICTRDANARWDR